MKFYRVHVRRADGASAFREDNAAPREGDFKVINVECSQFGILTALNVYGGHPDNG